MQKCLFQFLVRFSLTSSCRSIHLYLAPCVSRSRWSPLTWSCSTSCAPWSRPADGKHLPSARPSSRPSHFTPNTFYKISIQCFRIRSVWFGVCIHWVWFCVYPVGLCIRLVCVSGWVRCVYPVGLCIRLGSVCVSGWFGMVCASCCVWNSGWLVGVVCGVVVCNVWCACCL